MTDACRPHVSRTAYLLGFAGLLPQMAAVVPMLAYDSSQRAMGALGLLIALIYPASILSFLGGIWWTFAVHRTRHQAGLLVIAVLPSLFAAAILCWAAVRAASVDSIGMFENGYMRGPLLALGAAVLLTLPVDRRLAATGEAPEGWMRLRVPLSLGLGGLTILAGLLAR